MKYILVAQTCEGCGSEMAVKTFSSYPKYPDEKLLHESLGGMFCIKTKLFEAKDNSDEYEEIDYLIS